MSDPGVVAAKREAEAARADFAATLHELQTRLSPREMARSAIDTARDRGEDLAERGVEFARERPAATAGIAAAAIAVVAHRPLWRGLKSLFTSSKPARIPAQPRSHEPARVPAQPRSHEAPPSQEYPA